MFLGLGLSQSNAQIKVLSNGDILGSNTSPSSARAHLDFNLTSTSKPVAQFGAFGIQSHSGTNGFLINNGYFDAGWKNYLPGYMHWLQFVDRYTIFRSTTTAQPAGGNFNDGSGELSIVASAGVHTKVGISMPRTALAPSYELHVHGQAGKTSGGSDWIVISDKRLKKNINKFNDGLETLLKINPVSFEYNGKAGTEDNGESYIGLIAQDMVELAPYTVKKYEYEKVGIASDGVNINDGNKKEEYLSLDNSALRYVIINAVKEQHKIIEDQQKIIEEQDEKITELEDKVNLILKLLEKNSDPNTALQTSKSYLLQNMPNPFSETTEIGYYIDNLSDDASIEFYDSAGKLVYRKMITHAGKGMIDLNSGDLTSGVYYYRLLLDGELIDTKKLVLESQN